jgi:threonine dehydrogenase-like Zn-dependent dehydrogenase
MRAVVLRGGVLEVRDTPDPVPGPGELLVKTLSTAICASDVHFMDHPDLMGDPSSGMFLYDEGTDIVMGHEFVGEVVGHGPDCSERFPVGTRVTSMAIRMNAESAAGYRIIGQHPDAHGSFGELFVLSEMMTRAVPDGVPNDAVALVDAFAVGEYYVRVSGVGPGDIAMVIGAGAIGLSAVAALAARRVEHIIVSDLKPDRRALAEQFGATQAVDPSDRSPFQLWRDLAREHRVRTPMFVYECVGAAGLIQHIVDSCDMHARIGCAGGWYTGDSLNCTTATQKGITITFGGGPGAEDWYGTFDAVCQGQIDPLPAVGRVIGLEDVPEALDLTRRSAGPPRIVVHPNG